MRTKQTISKAAKENLRRRILVPLGIGLAVLVATCVFSLVKVKTSQIHDDIDQHLIGVSGLLETEVAEEADLMGLLIDAVASDKKVQTAWLERNRGDLATVANSYFTKFQRDYQVSDFSFVDRTHNCFLCVHETDCPDDSISHFVLQQAAKSLTTTFGLEIGESGTLAMHVVKPWYIEQQLVGFMEMGRDTGPIIAELNQTFGVDLLIAVRKEFMDSVSWTNGRTSSRLANNWSRFRDFVLVETTLDEIPDYIEKYMVSEHSRHQDQSFNIEHDGRSHVGRPLALLTADGTDIGDILVLQDISSEKEALSTLTIITIVSGVVVGSLLFGLFYIILGRIERKLHQTRCDWMTEIDERKRIMDELAGHNDFMKNVFESLTHPFYVIDAKTYQIVMGNEATGLIGQPANITCHELTHHNDKPCDSEDHVCPLKEARLTKKPVKVEHLHFDAQGNERHVEVHGYPILSSDGEVVQLIEYTLDITERKRIEKELVESRTLSRMIIETAGDAFIAIDANGVVEDWNRKAETMFGWLSKEVIGKQLSELVIGPESAEIHNKTLAHCVRTGQGPILNKRIEVTAQHRNGLSFPVELTVWATRKSTGMQFNAFITDITERKLAEAEVLKFKTISDMATYGVAIAGLDTKFIYTNESFARMHGRTPDWFIGQRVLGTLARGSRLDGIKAIRSLRNDGSVGPQEFWHSHKNGHDFPGLINLVMIQDANGKPAFVAAVLVDISEQKTAEQQLRESEEQFRYLFEQSNDAIFVHTTEGQIITANQRSSEMLGYDHERLLDLSVHELHPDSEKEGVERAFETIRSKGSIQFQSRFRKEDGSIIDVEISSRMMDEEQGIIQGVVRDISERVRQESELRKLSAAVDQSANLICISTPDGIIEYVNPVFCSTTGYSSTEAIGQPTSLLGSGHHDDAFFQGLWRDISSGKTWSSNVRNRKKNGELFWARLTITPIFNDSQTIVNHLAILEDVTNEIAAQLSLAETDKLSAIGTLAGGVAHEFKNYLAGIMGNASFALSGLDDHDGLDIARESLEKVVELSELANDVAMSLLTYSKAKPEEIAPEDLKGIIENSVRLVEKEIRNHSIEILTHFEDLPKMRVSASKIQQVLLNLIINARHAIESDGIITIGLLSKDDQVLIKVSDTGRGISEANISRIFDPFYSTKGVWGKDAISGTGMGLSICRNIAHEHKGNLTVASAVGVGTTFTLWLPLTDAGEGKFDASSNTTEPTTRLLLFSKNNALVSEYLRQVGTSGPHMEVVDDADQISGDLNNIVDAVICDVGMPTREHIHRMLEVCHKCGVPYFLVNCEDSKFNYAAAEHSALSVHAGTPALDALTELLRSKSAPNLNC